MNGRAQPADAVILCVGINGLGALRSLAAAGISCAVVFPRADRNVRHSRYPTSKHCLREDDQKALLDALAPYASAGSVVIPTSDAFAEFLSHHRQSLIAQGMRVIVSVDEVTRSLNDKRLEIETIGGHGVPLPRSVTRLSPNPDDLFAQLSAPVIIKPRSFRDAGMIRGKNVIVHDRVELNVFLQSQKQALDRFIAQEVIPGPDEDLWVCNCCFDEHYQLRSAFTFQRIRTAPPHFGVTSFAISRNNKTIKDRCAQIGAALRYIGPAMIEFKYHRDLDDYIYIETNPRLGMCNIFDTSCGVNNVLAAFRLARGEDPHIDPYQQIDGRYYLNPLADFEARCDDNESLNEIFRSYWHARAAISAWPYYDPADPMPAVYSAARHASPALRALARRFIHNLLRSPLPAAN